MRAGRQHESVSGLAKRDFVIPFADTPMSGAGIEMCQQTRIGCDRHATRTELTCLATGTMQMADDAFEDLLASLRWGAELPLTREQRAEVKDLCCRIAGLSVANISSWRLKEEAEAKRAALERAAKAEQRVKELENRKWWQRI